MTYLCSIIIHNKVIIKTHENFMNNLDPKPQILYVIYGEYGNIPNCSITQEIYASSFEEALKIFKQENENETDWFNSFIELNGNWD